MDKIRQLIKQEITGLKELEVFWLLASCTVIIALIIYWGKEAHKNKKEAEYLLHNPKFDINLLERQLEALNKEDNTNKYVKHNNKLSLKNLSKQLDMEDK